MTITRKIVVDIIASIAFVAMFATIIVVKSAPANADAGTYNDLFHWVDWMAKKYNLGTVYVDQEYMEPGVYGVSVGRTITFNSLYIDNPDMLYSSLVNDLERGFHPGKDCTATQYLAAHEAAHVLDTVTGFSARDELASALNNGLSGMVSGYSFNEDGSVNYGEALADAVAAVECDTPTPAQQSLYNMIAYAG